MAYPHFFFLITFVVHIHVSLGSFYHDNGGPANWPNIYKECGGEHQSPIPLPRGSDAVAQSDFPTIVRSDTVSKIPKSITVSKNEETVYVELFFENGGNITISGGPLTGTYKLRVIHFHWGDQGAYGSEHSINGTFYPMELHAVHYHSKHKSMEDAQINPDGLVVISYFFQVVLKTTNPAMDSLTSTFKYLQQKDVTNTDVQNPFPLDQLIPSFQHNYMTYNGSLTTPPCYETVKWIVYGSPLEISETHIARFRALYDVEPGMTNNFRPSQAANGRKVIAKSVK